MDSKTSNSEQNFSTKKDFDKYPSELQQYLHESLFLDLMDASETGITIFQLEKPDDDRSFKLIFRNIVGERISTIPNDQLLGKYIDDAYPNLRKHNLPQTYLQLLKENKKMDLGEIDYSDPHYPRRILKVNAFPLKNNCIGIISEDITIQKDLENQNLSLKKETENVELELRKTLSELARSNADLEQYAYAVSHDLREPVRTQKSISQIILNRLQDKLDSNSVNLLQRIIASAEKMDRMIHDLLEFSRLNNKTIPFTHINLNQIYSDIRQNLASLINQTQTVITCDNLPTVNGIGSQLNELFQNLIENTIKFRKSNTPAIITIQLKDLNAHEWLFSIKDNGIGINSDHIKQLFVIFKRLNPNDKYPGTGIGLALCKRIVIWHGGQIWLESTVGEGTTFFFTLPKIIE